jgi:hypothetical protein
MQRFLEAGEEINIVEIGSGYGGLAEKWIKNNKVSKYIICDLEKILRISQAYIEAACTEEQSSKVIYTTSEELPSTLRKELSDNRTIFVNTRSFMEMRWSVIRYYFSCIQRFSKAKDLFFQANRYSKIMSGDEVCLRDYPYDGYWDLLSMSNSIHQPYICQICAIRREQIDRHDTLRVVLRSQPRHLFYKDGSKSYIKYYTSKITSLFSWFH